VTLEPHELARLDRVEKRLSQIESQMPTLASLAEAVTRIADHLAPTAANIDPSRESSANTESVQVNPGRQSQPRGWFDTAGAAAALGMSVSGLRKIMATGKIRYAQTSKWGVIRFRPEWLEVYLERIAKGGSNEPQPQPKPAKRKPTSKSVAGLINPGAADWLNVLKIGKRE
jgi:hypothetical protein